MHEQDERATEATLCRLAEEHDEELAEIRRPITKCTRLIDETRVGPSSNGIPSAKVKLPTLEIKNFAGNILSVSSF